MKTLLLVLTLLLALSGLGRAQSLETLYAEPGYPYGELVRRSKQVRLNYYAQGQQISCLAEVENNGQQWQGTRQLIDAEDFEQAPFESCLDRREAKLILGELHRQS